ncbi:MAG: prepilin-type N-terminal cleavage/methylation domain-containing protein [Candidatus Omnitrophota bacterium]
MRIYRGAGNNQGFTFIEVMTALVILAFGITAVYRVFLKALDYQQGLTSRLYAQHLITRKISDLRETIKRTAGLQSQESEQVRVRLDHYPRTYRIVTRLTEDEDLAGLWRADILAAWNDRDRTLRMDRSVLLSQF